MVLTPKKYFMIINVLLIAAGLYFGVSAFYTIGTSWLGAPVEQPSRALSKATTEPQAETRPLSAYRAIAQRNLFNTNPETVAPAQTINVDDLKETDLKLKLWGTVAGEGRRAYAVIEDTKTREQSLYRTGDSIECNLKNDLKAKGGLERQRSGRNFGNGRARLRSKRRCSPAGSPTGYNPAENARILLSAAVDTQQRPD